MNFDDLLTADEHKKGAEVQIISPKTGEPTDFYITVMGPDTKEFRRAKSAAIRQSIKDDGDNYEESALDVILSVTIGWRGLTREGKSVDFTKEDCKRLYENSPFVLDQVDLFLADRKNFTKG